jgi:hypothetical protein
MKHLFIIFLLFPLMVLSVPGNAQINQQAKIVLKNGIIIRGGIVDSFDDSKLQVRIDSSNIILLRYDHIKKISFKGNGKTGVDSKEILALQPSLNIESFYHEIRGGLLIGEENTSFTVQTINGYQFNRYLGTGLGLGINKYGNYLTMPIYATIKGYLFDKKVSPFYFADLGYGFAWQTNKNENMFELDNVQGGLYWQVGLGYQINFLNSAMVFTLGYSNQDSKADYTYYRGWDISNVEVSERRILRRFAISIGFLF